MTEIKGYKCWVCNTAASYDPKDKPFNLLILGNGKSINTVIPFCSAGCWKSLSKSDINYKRLNCSICDKIIENSTPIRYWPNESNNLIHFILCCTKCRNTTIKYDEKDVSRVWEEEKKKVWKKCLGCAASERFIRAEWIQILGRLKNDAKQFVTTETVFACNPECGVKIMSRITSINDSYCYACPNKIYDCSMLPYNVRFKKSPTHTSAILYCNYKCFKKSSKVLRKTGEIAYMCEYCDKVTFDQKMMMCNGCKMSYYCDESCQKKDWAGCHKIKCKCAKDLKNNVPCDKHNH